MGFNPSKPGLKIDPGGRHWSDVIGCGFGFPMMFVSERLLADLKEQEIPILRATEMPIASNSAFLLKFKRAPKYYVLEAIPGMGMSKSLDSDGKALQKSRLELPAYDSSTWNGLDLFSDSNGFGNTSLMCTERIKELAEQKNWSNIEFTPLDVIKY